MFDVDNERTKPTYEEQVEHNLGMGNFLCQYNILIQALGPLASMLFCQLLSEYYCWKRCDKLLNNAWFYSTFDNIEKRLGFSRRMQQTYIQFLKDYGIIKQVTKQIEGYNKRYFCINMQMLAKLTKLNPSTLIREFSDLKLYDMPESAKMRIDYIRTVLLGYKPLYILDIERRIQEIRHENVTCKELPTIENTYIFEDPIYQTYSSCTEEVSDDETTSGIPAATSGGTRNKIYNKIKNNIENNNKLLPCDQGSENSIEFSPQDFSDPRIFENSSSENTIRQMEEIASIQAHTFSKESQGIQEGAVTKFNQSPQTHSSITFGTPKEEITPIKDGSLLQRSAKELQAIPDEVLGGKKLKNATKKSLKQLLNEVAVETNMDEDTLQKFLVFLDTRRKTRMLSTTQWQNILQEYKNTYQQLSKEEIHMLIDKGIQGGQGGIYFQQQVLRNKQWNKNSYNNRDNLANVPKQTAIRDLPEEEKQKALSELIHFDLGDSPF